MVPLLQDLTIGNTAAAQAQGRLLRWNYVLDKDSVEAGIYEMWQRRLISNVRDLSVPKEVRDNIGNIDMTKIIRWLNAPDGRFGANPIAGRDAMLTKSLEEAVAELTKRLGPEQGEWKLGAFHHATIPHFMTAALQPEQRSKFDVGDLPRGGDSYTVTATGGADNQTSGGSFKIIVDTEDWDGSVGLNNPGQSGDVNDPHYRDLYQLWARGKYFPIFYSRPKVESVTEKSWHMEPAGSAVTTTAR